MQLRAFKSNYVQIFVRSYNDKTVHNLCILLTSHSYSVSCNIIIQLLLMYSVATYIATSHFATSFSYNIKSVLEP